MEIASTHAGGFQAVRKSGKGNTSAQLASSSVMA